MARFRRAAAPARKPNRGPMRVRGATAEKEDVGDDGWALVDAPRKSTDQASSPSTVDATDKQDKEDSPPLPTPISATIPLGKIITADGQEHPYYHEPPRFVYEPTHVAIAGFEHCFRVQSPAPRQVAQVPSVIQSQPARLSAASRNVSAAPATRAGPRSPRRKTLKRSRSVARGHSQRSTIQHPGQDEDRDEGDHDYCRVTTEESHTFYIGNIAELTKFLLHRWDEVPTKPLRAMLTAWIRELEPRRLRVFGRYGKVKASQLPPERTPPWWPRDVRFLEPAHLGKQELKILAVAIMLQHREVDLVKRKRPWVAKLRYLAQYAIDTTTPESLTSSKNLEYSAMVRERTVSIILPSLFDVAQSHEDHLAQYNLYEGEGNKDPGTGKRHTWHPIPRLPRQLSQVKRARGNDTVAVLKVECSEDGSGDETEVDDTISNSFLRRDQIRAAHALQKANGVARTRQQAPASATSTLGLQQSPPAPQEHFRLNHHNLTPNTSFNQTMNNLHVSGSMDMDVKGGSLAPYSDQSLLNNMYSLGESMQYSRSHPGYTNPVFQSQEHVGSFTNSSPSFASGPALGFGDQFLFNASYSPQVCNSTFSASQASANTSFPYEFGSVFTATPGGIVPHTNRSFHGLPNIDTFDGDSDRRRRH